MASSRITVGVAASTILRVTALSVLVIEGFMSDFSFAETSFATAFIGVLTPLGIVLLVVVAAYLAYNFKPIQYIACAFGGAALWQWAENDFAIVDDIQSSVYTLVAIIAVIATVWPYERLGFTVPKFAAKRNPSGSRSGR